MTEFQRGPEGADLGEKAQVSGRSGEIKTKRAQEEPVCSAAL